MALQNIDRILYIYVYEAMLASCNLPVGEIMWCSKPFQIEIHIHIFTSLDLNCFALDKNTAQS